MTVLLEARGLMLNCRLGPADLSVEAGSCIAIIGPNGGGKTSLLRAIAGVEDAIGSVAVEGESLAECSTARRSRLLAFVPASRELVWPVSVRDLLMLGHDNHDEVDLETIIAQFELQPLADRRADFLSTGERARVLLARALLARPRLLLLDEPMSNLDPYWVAHSLAAIRESCQGQKAAALVVIHDLRLVEAFDRILLVSKGQIKFDGPTRALPQAPEFRHAFRVDYGDAISPRADRQSLR